MEYLGVLDAQAGEPAVLTTGPGNSQPLSCKGCRQKIEARSSEQPKTRLAYRCEPLLGAKGELVPSSVSSYAGDEERFWHGTCDFQHFQQDKCCDFPLWNHSKVLIIDYRKLQAFCLAEEMELLTANKLAGTAGSAPTTFL